MKTKLKSIWLLVLGQIITLLGVSGCSKILGFIAPCMYGQPYSEFTLKGTVTDEEGKPIERIRVAVDYYSLHESEKKPYSRDTLYSDASGKIDTVYTRSGVLNSTGIDIKLEDIDGEAGGGRFQTLTLSGTPQKTADGTDTWDMGKYLFEFTGKMKNGE